MMAAVGPGIRTAHAPLFVVVYLMMRLSPSRVWEGQTASERAGIPCGTPTDTAQRAIAERIGATTVDVPGTGIHLLDLISRHEHRPHQVGHPVAGHAERSNVCIANLHSLRPRKTRPETP